MKDIKPIRAYCSNFLSYGSNVNEFFFNNDGITWIKGPNGSGKSVWIDVISMACFNKPFRKIKKNKGARNSSNRTANTIVGYEFKVIQGEIETNWIIERKITKGGTSSIKLFKDKVEQPKEAGITQKKIEEEILGYDHNIFENIISLNTIQTVPIIDMEPDKKRKLLESVATIHLDKLKKLNKETLKDVQVKFKAATNDYEQYTKDVAELKIILEKLKQEKKEGIADLEFQVNTINQDISETKEYHEKASTDLKVAKENGVTKKSEINALGDVDNKISNYNNIITHLEYLEIADKSISEKKKAQEDNENLLKQYQEELDKIDFEPLEYDGLVSNHKKMSENMNELTYKVKNQTESLEAIIKKGQEIKHGVECPTCKKLSTEEDVKIIKDAYREEYKALSKELTSNKEHLKQITSDVGVLNDEIETLKKNKESYKEVETKISYLMETIRMEGVNTARDDLSNQSKREEIQSLLKENGQYKMLSVDEISNELTNLDEVLNKKKELTAELDKIRTEATKLIENVKFYKEHISSQSKKLNDLNNKLEEKKATDIDDACNRTEKKLTNTQADLERASQRITKYSDQIKVCKYIEGMYNDDGIKQLILHEFVPTLNKTVAHNLIQFELPFTITFDDSMEYTFGGDYGLAEEYGGLSQGQRRKLNFAISMAFRDFVLSIADFNIDILFLDEVLDISTDDEALSHMLELLKNKIEDIGQIYIMTHRGDGFKEYFDHIVQVSHDGRYSTVEKIK